MNQHTDIRFPTPSIQTKLPTIGMSIFSVMSAKAHDVNALNLSQGFPDFAADPLLAELVGQSILLGHNQYAPLSGVKSLRESISQIVRATYNANYDAETEITITSGATEALFTAISAIINPEDEVIVFDPCYDSYVPSIVVNGGIPVHIPLTYPDYSIDWDIVKRRINRKTKAIILNSPHNPTGSVLSEQDMHALIDLTQRNEIFIISDEVYEHVIYDGLQHQSICRYPELAARSFMIGSFGKSLHVTGWKVGYCLAPAPLTLELRKLHQYVTFSTCTPIQTAIAAYINQKPNLFVDLKTFFQAKRDYFRTLMQESRFEPLPSRGSYFQLFSFHAISDENDQDFCMRLAAQYGVAAIPVSVFYRDKTDKKVIRLCFAKENTTLETAAAKLCKV